MFAIKRIDDVALTVRDVGRSIAWYRDVLGLERRLEQVWGDNPVMMFAGDTALALFQARRPISAAPDQEAAAPISWKRRRRYASVESSSLSRITRSHSPSTSGTQMATSWN